MSSWKTLVKYTFYVTPFPLPCMQSNLPRSHLTPENPGEQQRALQAPWGGQDDTERGMRISGALTKASLSPILTPKSHGKFSNGKKTILRDKMQTFLRKKGHTMIKFIHSFIQYIPSFIHPTLLHMLSRGCVAGPGGQKCRRGAQRFVEKADIYNSLQ